MASLKKRRIIIFYIVALYSLGCNQSELGAKKLSGLSGKIVILKGYSLCTKCVSLNRTVYERYKSNVVVLYPSIREIEIEASNNLEFGTNDISTYNDFDLFKKINELSGYKINTSSLVIVSQDSLLYSSKYEEIDFSKIDEFISTFSD